MSLFLRPADSAGRPLLAVVVAAAVLLVPVTPSSADPPAPAAGTWPLDPRPPVVAGFDPPTTRWGAGHRGVDLGGHLGQQVWAAAAGRVSFAGDLAGRGVVVVDHGATRTTYEPVTASVSVGDLVAAGAVVGRLQLFGSHCFPRTCLHWGLIEGAEHYLDPLTLVGGGPVRLLPLDGGPLGTLLAGAVPSLGPSLAGRRGSSALFRGVLRPADGPAGRPAGADPW
jgi:murein DD-endopeptidase MepM/ murein hydrolase activator NlpD